MKSAITMFKSLNPDLCWLIQLRITFWHIGAKSDCKFPHRCFITYDMLGVKRYYDTKGISSKRFRSSSFKKFTSWSTNTVFGQGVVRERLATNSHDSSRKRFYKWQKLNIFLKQTNVKTNDRKRKTFDTISHKKYHLFSAWDDDDSYPKNCKNVENLKW